MNVNPVNIGVPQCLEGASASLGRQARNKHVRSVLIGVVVRCHESKSELNRLCYSTQLTLLCGLHNPSGKITPTPHIPNALPPFPTPQQPSRHAHPRHIPPSSINTSHRPMAPTCITIHSPCPYPQQLNAPTHDHDKVYPYDLPSPNCSDMQDVIVPLPKSQKQVGPSMSCSVN